MATFNDLRAVLLDAEQYDGDPDAVLRVLDSRLNGTRYRDHHSEASRVSAASGAVIAAVIVAAVVVGAALGMSPSRTIHAGAPSASAVPTSRGIRDVSYRIDIPQRVSPLGCIPPPTSTRDYWFNSDGCGADFNVLIDPDTTLPSNAQALTIPGLTGVYGLTDGDVRTVWAPNGRGGYESIVVNAENSYSSLAQFITPTN